MRRLALVALVGCGSSSNPQVDGGGDRGIDAGFPACDVPEVEGDFHGLCTPPSNIGPLNSTSCTI